MCSETSPRLSFSHDLSQAEEEEEEVAAIDQNESRRDTILLELNQEFEFSISSSSEQESSSADELFANGVILPVQIQDKAVVAAASNHIIKKYCSAPSPSASSLPPLPPPPPPSPNDNSKIVNGDHNSDLQDQKPQAQAKSFWGFKRSSSLNHEAKKSLICSLPLLSRSNSTGSVPSKRSSMKDNHKTIKPSSTSQQRPPLKKNYVGAYGNGVKISPVLNVPPPYISKGTANLFGLGSLLRNGSRDKKNKK